MSDESNKLLQALIDCGVFSTEKVLIIRTIKERSPGRVNYKDTRVVALMVHKMLSKGL